MTFRVRRFCDGTATTFLGIPSGLPEVVVLRYDRFAPQTRLQLSLNRSVSLLPRLLISINFGEKSA